MTAQGRPDEGERDWGGRLPLAELGALDQDAQRLAAVLHEYAVPWAERAGFAATTDRGHLIGPWNAQLHRPVPSTAFNHWVATDQQETSLGPRVREVAILTVAVAWRSDYEIYSHVAAARTAGLSEPAIAGLLARMPGDDLTDDELAVHRFTDELVREHGVDEHTYHEATGRLGRDGVLDLVALVGIYLATAAALAAFRVPAPAARPSG